MSTKTNPAAYGDGAVEWSSISADDAKQPSPEIAQTQARLSRYMLNDRLLVVEAAYA